MSGVVTTVTPKEVPLLPSVTVTNASPAAPAVSSTGKNVVPAGITTVAGTGNTIASVVLIDTVVSLVLSTSSWRYIVPVAPVCNRLEKLVVTVGAPTTVTSTCRVLPPSVAVMTALPTTPADSGTLEALVVPAAIVTDDGTVTTAGLLEDKLTLVSDEGATFTPTDRFDVGRASRRPLANTAEPDGADNTFTLVDWMLAPSVAVIVAVPSPARVTGTVAEVYPDCMTTEAGTPTAAGLDEFSVTVV